MDLKPKSVRKKWNVKGFAAGADRALIEKGARMLGVEIDELISDVITGMREVFPKIGLG
jgi:predicted hydrolase (HD superfamily)